MDNFLERIKKLTEYREFFPFLALIILIVISSSLSPFFLTVRNISKLLTQVSIIAVLSAGETFVILTGGIDLSPGSLLALTGAVAAVLINIMGLPVIVGILGALVTGALAGATSGLLLTKVKIPSFIATLAMMSLARGAALIILGGSPVSGFPPSFNIINARMGPVSGLVIIMVAVYIVGQLILSKTKIGRYIYAIGGNEEAARFTGLQVDKIKLFVFMFAGLCAGLAGLMMDARLSAAYPNVGVGYELDAIAASVLGGASFSGGVGTLRGTLMGALIMAILSNVLNLLQVPAFYQYVARGAVLALAATSLSRGVEFQK